MLDQQLRLAKAGYLKTLASAIRHNFGCSALHKASSTVFLRLPDRTVELQIEIFQLIKYRRGDKCFAWFHPPTGPRHSTVVATVVADSNILTPGDAVRAYLGVAYDHAA